MAKKKASIRPTGSPLVWNQQVKDSIWMSYFLICKQIREYHNDAHVESVTGMIGYISVLRSIIERQPIWPRNAEFEKAELGKWCAKVRRAFDVAAKQVPASYRDEFKAAVNSDLDFLTEFMDRKKDPDRDV